MILQYRIFIFPIIELGCVCGGCCPQAPVAFSCGTAVLLRGDRSHSSMLYPSDRTSCSVAFRNRRYRQGGRLEHGNCPQQQQSSEIDRIDGVDHNECNVECRELPPRWSSKSCRWKVNQSVCAAVAVLTLVLSSGGPLGVLAQSTEDDADGDSESTDTPVWRSIASYVIIVVLVAASGLFSGLTLGLLGLDKIGLEIITNGDEPRMAAFAKVGRQKT